MTGGMELAGLQGYFQHKPFYDPTNHKKCSNFFQKSMGLVHEVLLKSHWVNKYINTFWNMMSSEVVSARLQETKAWKKVDWSSKLFFVFRRDIYTLIYIYSFGTVANH